MAGTKTKEIPDVTALEDLHALRIGLPLDPELRIENNAERLRRRQFEARYPRPPHYAKRFAKIRNRYLVASAAIGTAIGIAAHIITR
jgi:hypothetical protein